MHVGFLVAACGLLSCGMHVGLNPGPLHWEHGVFFFFLNNIFAWVYLLLIFKIFVYLFIYGCVGSSFLCEGFL